MTDPCPGCAGQFDCGGSESKHIPCWQVWLEAVTSDAWACLQLVGLLYVPGRPRSSLVIVGCLLAQVNDDFCDCMSGRDEPGTSACSQQGARFLCTDGQVAIPTSFLQDGFRYAWSFVHPLLNKQPWPPSPAGCKMIRDKLVDCLWRDHGKCQQSAIHGLSNVCD